MISDLLNPEFLKPVLLTVHQQMTRRIFDEGKDANNSQIGEYSDAYVKQRQKKGLGSSKKVILEFTGQMRNDFLLIQDGSNFGSGFTNENNGNKSEWVEDTYDKTIFDLTDQEEQLLEALINERVEQTLNE